MTAYLEKDRIQFVWIRIRISRIKSVSSQRHLIHTAKHGGGDLIIWIHSRDIHEVICLMVKTGSWSRKLRKLKQHYKTDWTRIPPEPCDWLMKLYRKPVIPVIAAAAGVVRSCWIMEVLSAKTYIKCVFISSVCTYCTLGGSFNNINILDYLCSISFYNLSVNAGWTSSAQAGLQKVLSSRKQHKKSSLGLLLEQ